MAHWDERLRGAAAWGYAERMQTLLANAPEAPDDLQRAHRDRLTWLATQVLAYRSTDGRAVTPGMVQSLDNSVGQLAANLDAWGGAGAATQLTACAVQYADNVVDVLRTWPPLGRDRVLRATREAAEAYQEESARALARMGQEVALAREGVEDVKQTAAAAKEAADKEIASLRSQVVDLENAIAGQEQRVGAALDGSQERFAAAETLRSDQFAQVLVGLEDRGAAALKEVRASAQRAIADAEQEAQEALQRLEAQERAAAVLVEAISIEGTATGYGAYAKQESKAAWGWAMAAVAVGLAGFAVILWALHGIHATTSWREVIVKIVASLTLGGVATYCGNQSSQHRTQERDAKRMQLNIAALNPFITNLPKDNQDKIRADFADRMFAPVAATDSTSGAASGAPGGAGTTSAGTPPLNVGDLVGQLTALAQAAQKIKP